MSRLTRPEPVGLGELTAAYLATVQEEACSSADLAALPRAYQELRRAYATGGGTPRSPTPATAAAYAVARLPATMAANVGALGEVRARLRWPPTTVLDIGCGFGPSALVSVALWPSIARVALVDVSDVSRTAASVLRRCLTAVRELDVSLAARLDDVGSAGLVVASYVLGELDDPSSAVDQWWSRTGHTLVIVEPGTPAGFGRVRAARERLVAIGGRVAAPCPHDLACPLGAGDWCHFAARVERSPAHRRVKTASLPVEEEPFTYLAVTRGDYNRPDARVLRPPSKRKGHVRLRLCRADGEADTTVVAKSDPGYRSARALGWGDPFPGDPTT